MGSFQKTDARHLDPYRGTLGSMDSQKKVGLGPQFTIEEKESFRFEFDPDHPDADENGMVLFPNVDVPEQMVDMISARRAYEANVTAIEAVKSMALKAMDISRR